MGEKISKEQRSKNMKAIKSISKLENEISKALWKNQIRYRRNVNSLYGKPDFAIKKYKIVIFIDSCFWHGCPLHGNMPQSNKDYWEQKLKRNITRDEEVTKHYLDKEWNILRLWEHEFKEDFDGAIQKITIFINDNK